jgi:hypothetical protein
MNTNLLDVVKRIIAEQGEDILANAQRLKPLISDYAKNEPKEERQAFGRCIEQGFYQQIKAARTAGERQRLKTAFTQVRVIGITILGIFIGLFISIIEEALREARLTIVWGPKETTAISPGQKPVVFGSSHEADVFLPQKHGQPEIPPTRAVVSIEGGKAILDDRTAGVRRELRNNETVDLSRVSIITNSKTGINVVSKGVMNGRTIKRESDYVQMFENRKNVRYSY